MLNKASPRGNSDRRYPGAYMGRPALEAVPAFPFSAQEADGLSGGLQGGEAPCSSLVRTLHNSSKAQAKTEICMNGHWVRGTCEHSNSRWRYIPCKSRKCEVCGPVGRWRIAERVALGVRTNWPCAWLVLTFAEDIDKKQAVRRLSGFVKWLRKSMPGLQYAATYELTRQSRLHINLIAGPWAYLEQAKLQERWGARVFVEWVRDDKSVGKETAKAYSPEGLGGYLSKLEQCVPTDRRVSYSKGWPKLPRGGLQRKGRIRWELPLDMSEVIFIDEKMAGYWRERLPGEWGVIGGDGCDCFELESSP